MPQPVQPFEGVGYSLPKTSSFGQAAVLKDSRRVWEITQNFLETLTVSRTVEARLNISEAHYFYLKEKACLGIWDAQGCMLTEAHIPQVIQLLSGQVQELSSFQSVRLTITIRFTWTMLTCSTGLVEQTQSAAAHSLLLCTYEPGRRMFFQPRFVFGVPWSEPIFADLIAQLRATLPFKLRPQCFYKLLARTGQTSKVDYYGKCLPPQAMELINTWLT